MDKEATKRQWQTHGLPTPDFVMLHAGSDWQAVADRLGLPLIVKPAREGSSIGLTKVTSAAELPAAYEKAARLDRDVMAEQFIEGDELTCPIIGEGESATALPLIRIVAPQANYDYQNKYFTDVTQYLVPSGLPAALEARIQELVVRAYRSLGCRGWGRADLMLRASDGEPFLLEMNTSPGMTGHSLVPMSAKAAGMSYEQLCLHLIANAALDH